MSRSEWSSDGCSSDLNNFDDLAEIEDIGDIKKRIIAKSSKLFITQGYNKTTIRRIAEESGLGRGHLYYYFKKKENILLQIYKSFLEKIYKYIIDNHTLGSSTLVSYAVSYYLYTNIIVNSDALFRIYIEASKVDIIRKEYVDILILFMLSESILSNNNLVVIMLFIISSKVKSMLFS